MPKYQAQIMYQYRTPQAIQQFVAAALYEDIGTGDHSTLAAVPADAIEEAKLIIKGEGVLAGVALAEMIFAHVEPSLELEILLQDGAQVKYGDIGLRVRGRAQAILTAERLVLNCMQRMSGIATLTHHITQQIAHTKARLLDTRKTTPNFRLAEKWAVEIGGGTNHRFGLFDMIMLKDNHIDYAGGIAAALQKAQNYRTQHALDIRIEVETRNLDEVRQVLAVGGADVIMLDNFTVPQVREALALIDGRVITEASGGITAETIVPIAETGVDFISMGALTHSAPSMDISLKAVKG